MTSLNEVVTISEAAKIVFVARTTIIYHIDRGNLLYRQTDEGLILIDRQSLLRLYARGKRETKTVQK